MSHREPNVHHYNDDGVNWIQLVQGPHHMVLSAQMVRQEKPPSVTAVTRSTAGCSRHFHHHSAVSSVSPSRPKP